MLCHFVCFTNRNETDDLSDGVFLQAIALLVHN